MQFEDAFKVAFYDAPMVTSRAVAEVLTIIIDSVRGILSDAELKLFI